MESRVIGEQVVGGDGEHLQLADGTEILAGVGFCLPDFPAGTVVTVWYRTVQDQRIAEVIRVRPTR
jgi:hypothetical protein